MTTRKCAQLWIVEAMWDGRVKGDERTAFERHLKTCQDCQEEAGILAQLKGDLRALPTRQPDPLSSRRQKQRLMATLDASTVALVSESRTRRALLIATALAATIAVVLFLRSKAWLAAPTAAQTTAGATIDVSADPGSRWYQTSAKGSHRVELLEGSFVLRITQTYPASRVILALPDGEIEDFGTVLSVKVAAGRTVAIAVTEGDVAVRLRGSPELRLRAGDSWLAPADRAVADSARTVAPPVESSAITPNHAPSAITEPRKHAKTESSKPALVESNREHATAAASSVSAESQATQAAEDKAYLDVLQLLRAGKEVEARDLAGDYLLRFPTGFRRVEMLNVAKGGPRRP